jgi:hypothetical protein
VPANYWSSLPVEFRSFDWELDISSETRSVFKSLVIYCTGPTHPGQAQLEKVSPRFNLTLFPRLRRLIDPFSGSQSKATLRNAFGRPQIKSRPGADRNKESIPEKALRTSNE